LSYEKDASIELSKCLQVAVITNQVQKPSKIQKQIYRVFQKIPCLPRPVWFQQDAAPAHYAVAMRETSGPWIAAFTGASGVAVRSPDLPSYDNALWGFIKLTAAHKRHMLIEELEKVIRSALASITAAMLCRFSHHT
jgi:hypothetical protein